MKALAPENTHLFDGCHPVCRLQGAAVAGLEPVELRCEDEIAFSEAVDLVRPGGDLRLAPAQQNIWVMALRFRYLAYFIHESERAFEIGKRKHLRNVVFVDDLPSGHLLRQILQFLTFQRRSAAAARDTGLSCKVGHIIIPSRAKDFALGLTL